MSGFEVSVPIGSVVGVGEPPSPEAVRARRAAAHTWFGYLADDNIEHVAQRIRNLLLDRPYTWVANNADMPRSLPEVRTSQRLTPEKATSRNAVNVHRIGTPVDYPGAERGRTWEAAGLSAVDTYGVWSMHTPYLTEREASEAARDEDPAVRARVTYLVIEGGATPDDLGRRSRIEVTHYNGMSPRQVLHWVIAPEHAEAW